MLCFIEYKVNFSTSVSTCQYFFMICKCMINIAPTISVTLSVILELFIPSFTGARFTYLFKVTNITKNRCILCGFKIISQITGVGAELVLCEFSYWFWAYTKLKRKRRRQLLLTHNVWYCILSKWNYISTLMLTQ